MYSKLSAICSFTAIAYAYVAFFNRSFFFRLFSNRMSLLALAAFSIAMVFFVGGVVEVAKAGAAELVRVC